MDELKGKSVETANSIQVHLCSKFEHEGDVLLAKMLNEVKCG